MLKIKNSDKERAHAHKEWDYRYNRMSGKRKEKSENMPSLARREIRRLCGNASGKHRHLK